MDTLPNRELVLVGAGHTHAHILRMWRMHAVPGVRLTVVSPYPHASYSGMLPGTLAGLYQPAEMLIDLRRLTASCGARLIVAAATGLDPERKLVHLEGRPPLAYDVCSVGIGSIPAGGDVWRNHPDVLGIKPMQTFLERLDGRLQLVPTNEKRRVVVVGGGAAGVEVTFCLDAKLRRETPPSDEDSHTITLVDSGPRILSGHRAGTVRRVKREMDERGITRLLERRAVDYRDSVVVFENGDPLPADVVIWAAGAAPPPVLEGFDLPKADDGFLAVDATLRTASGDDVFVVGDTATLVDSPIPKAGVYAVREGPVLWDNLRNALDRQPLRRYRPQSGFLSLLSYGDGRAVGEYLGFSFEGRWVWRLKDWIDRSFMQKHRDFRPMTTEMMTERRAATDELGAVPRMRCRGCGGKVGAGVLAQALDRIDALRVSRTSSRATMERDDAAVLTGDAARVDLATIDAFQSFDDDAYLVGRVAALNALGDVWAMGGRPTGALAVVTLPEGRRSQQVELLFQALAGALREFDGANVRLLGGHTREGEEFAIGFTAFGQLDGREPFRNGNLKAGDRLLLTKPLGTGTLLAAHMQAACEADWFESMTRSMLVPNDSAAAIVRTHDVVAATDVTGFGLAGHLLEMLDASRCSARIDLSALPLLPGFAEASAAGHRSSLDAANREVESRVEIDDSTPDEIRETPGYHALFDPQTSGGLLIAVAADRAEVLAVALRESGLHAAAIVGEGVEHDPTNEGEPTLQIVGWVPT